MKRAVDTGIPEFNSLDKERDYWEAHGPLAEGRKGKINKPRAGQKRSSFLAVRLTGAELTALRNIAAKLGLGPSTFARIVLTSTIKSGGELPKRIITGDNFAKSLENNLPETVRERFKELFKSTAIGGDLEDPALIIIDAGQRKKLEELMWPFFAAICESAGIKLITSDNTKYQKVKDLVKT